MPSDTQITVFVLVVLGYILITAVLTTLATRVRIHTQRHQLIVEARQRRSAYLQALSGQNEQ